MRQMPEFDKSNSFDDSLRVLKVAQSESLVLLQRAAFMIENSVALVSGDPEFDFEHALMRAGWFYDVNSLLDFINAKLGPAKC